MADSDPAAGRFFLLQLLRLACMGVAVAGGILFGRYGNDLGGVLLVLGALAFFTLPRLLARRWKSPDA